MSTTTFRAFAIIVGLIVIYSVALLFNSDVYKLMAISGFAVALDIIARDIITKLILNSAEGKALIEKLKGEKND